MGGSGVLTVAGEDEQNVTRVAAAITRGVAATIAARVAALRRAARVDRVRAKPGDTLSPTTTMRKDAGSRAAQPRASAPGAQQSLATSRQMSLRHPAIPVDES